MSLRMEFVALAGQAGANISALCRSYGISRKTGYKWLERGDAIEASRRPHQSPGRTVPAIEQLVMATRDQFADWGARKIKQHLLDNDHAGLPALSTITAILRRHGRVSPQASAASTPWQRFEHNHPNALWQIDFKGHVAMTRGRCHPLTLLDDHSRFNLLLHACAGEGYRDVQKPLESVFRRYGLPHRISCDNGSPWGTTQRQDRLTRLGVWLIQLGVGLSHARPYHPQTNGKNERFHRTLKSGLLQRRVLRDLADAQHAFDDFRTIYNQVRPHQAIGMAVPITRYRPSDRAYPERLPPIAYPAGALVRKVDSHGRIAFRGGTYRISKALQGLPVALQPDPEQDGRFDVFFCQQPIRQIDLSTCESVD